MQPTQLGPYSIGSRLGRGGMGAVYEGVDTFGGGAVAVKVLAAHLADDPGLRRRFESEIDTLKSLRHPGIVQLLAFGEQDGQPYYAMELVRGSSVDALLRAGRRFTWQETVTAARAITRALKTAHDHGVIHRDLKPANLLLAEGAPVDAIKLADFGIAKLFGGATHTALGNAVGTAEYMAPEQAAGKPLDARADLYALGLVMFAMLTGKPPFRAPNVAHVLRMQQTAPPPRLDAVVPDLPAAVDDIIQRLLAKDPADRPANALALGRLLAAIDTSTVSEAVSATGPIVLDERGGDHRQAQTVRHDGQTAPLRSQPRGGVDQFAPTRDLTVGKAAEPADAAGVTKPVGSPATRRATDVGADSTPADTAPRTTHTTLAQIEQEARAAIAAQRRRERWMRLGWAATIAAMLGGGGYLLLRPLSADDLHARINAILAADADRPNALRDAEPLIDQFMKTFPTDPRAAEIGGLRREIDIDRLRIRAERRVKKDVSPHLRIERDYRVAMDLKTSDPRACIAALRDILALPAGITAAVVAADPDADELARNPELWRELISWQIQQLTPMEDAEKRIDRHDAARKRP